MSNYGNMRTRIAGELQRGNLTSFIQDAILSALRFYKRQPFRWNITRTQTTLADGVEFYALPTDFIEAYSVVLTEGSELELLTERSYFWVEEAKQWSDYKSRPYVYTVQNDEFRVYPVPDKAYVVTMNYVYELPEPSTDASTNAWFTDGEELIRTHAKVDLLENVIRGQESLQEAQILRGREQEILSQLRREYKRSQSSGRITPRLGMN